MEKEVYREMFEGQDTFWWHKAMRKFFEVFFAKYIGSAQNTILDIGCGTGALFPVFAKYGTLYGIDLSEEAVMFARRCGIAQDVALGNASALPFAANKFDVVACSDLLYHAGVANDREVLREIYRVLRPGGMLIIKEASYDWLRSRMDELVHTKHRYTKTELKQKLSDAHFHTIRITHMMTFLFPLALIARLMERVFPRTYSAHTLFRASPPINALFTAITFAEAFCLRWINFSFGLSIIAAARKNNAPLPV